MKAPTLRASGEHHDEPVHGLPGELPPGEHILWQGSPRWQALALQVLHARKVAVYFALLLAWRLASMGHDGASLGEALAALPRSLPMVALCLGLLCTLAWLMARTTVYTLTNRRIVMRVGIVLTVTFNLPLSRIESAALRQRGSTGDLSLRLAPGNQIAYLNLWPHARPWRMARTEPMLRALPQAQAVADQVAAALQASAAATAMAQAGAGLPVRVALARMPASDGPGSSSGPAASAAVTA